MCPISFLQELSRIRDGVYSRGEWCFFFFQAEDGIRDDLVTGVQTCALPILSRNDGPFAKMTARDVTNSIGSASEPTPTESDLAFARNAASDVLTKGDKDSSQQIGRASCRERV